MIVLDFFEELLELKPIPDETEDHLPPPYGKPGRILFDVLPDRVEDERIEVVDYDGDTSVFWINEGIGFDWFFEYYTNYINELEPGRYIMTVNGHYIRGLTWRESPDPTDDDEEWEVIEDAKKTGLESL